MRNLRLNLILKDYAFIENEVTTIFQNGVLWYQ